MRLYQLGDSNVLGDGRVIKERVDVGSFGRRHGWFRSDQSRHNVPLPEHGGAKAVYCAIPETIGIAPFFGCLCATRRQRVVSQSPSPQSCTTSTSFGSRSNNSLIRSRLASLRAAGYRDKRHQSHSSQPSGLGFSTPTHIPLKSQLTWNLTYHLQRSYLTECSTPPELAPPTDPAPPNPAALAFRPCLTAVTAPTAPFQL
jgi:hypothetical protein